MDGRCAGSIVAKFESNYSEEDFFEVDYMMELPLEEVSEGERVYFVDYSFQKNTVWILDKLINEKDCEVIWIDHHTSSLNLQRDNEYKWVNGIPGIRQDKISGAALTYMYLYNTEFHNIPYYIRLVSDYDCWIYNYDPHTTHFKLGIDMENNDALDYIWKRLFEDDKVMQLSGGLTKTAEKIISKGKLLKSYIDKDNQAYREAYAYETLVGGVRCLAVNRKTNSWIFGEKYNEYPIVMVYAFNGKKWSYSIFSSDKNIDCSKIAESYGGGGHKGAAGFSLDDMPFKKVDGEDGGF